MTKAQLWLWQQLDGEDQRTNTSARSRHWSKPVNALQFYFHKAGFLRCWVLTGQSGGWGGIGVGLAKALALGRNFLKCAGPGEPYFKIIVHGKSYLKDDHLLSSFPGRFVKRSLISYVNWAESFTHHRCGSAVATTQVVNRWPIFLAICSKPWPAFPPAASFLPVSPFFTFLPHLWWKNCWAGWSYMSCAAWVLSSFYESLTDIES